MTGQTGTGKTWLACAFGRQAARLDHSVLYLRMPRLFEDLALARHCLGRGVHSTTVSFLRNTHVRRSLR
ncbi:ATP-binding protein [Mesorhizobium sp. M0408]|uniref:ATP-binding protein n=1 Tax=Mesorhizobium sp. M0408 TaxID=2956942 RepID=UPI00333648A3